MKSLYDVLAPAKLNLFLHVTGRRDDGYHLLQSAFMLIDWCDTLHFEARSDGGITREDLTVPLPDNDLILRAARALQKVGSTTQGVHIGVSKSIPSQAGMGGGSSDAASTLLALNRLWGLNLPLTALNELGLALGSDVPFFLQGHNAWVEGIGEKLTPIDLPAARFLVVKPHQGLETAQIFSRPDLKRDTETAIMSGFAANPYCFGRNDLQAVAESVCPEIAEALNWLELAAKRLQMDPDRDPGSADGIKGRMTGSGSAVFALVPAGMGQQIDVGNAPSGATVRLCRNLAQHPLLGWAAN
jgi:4-diphosphocytidyl-2-C-methyl-D-erythritol kinase